MNAPIAHPVAHAVVDADGHLLDADPAIVTLNARAGGTVGEALAVPQLATIARLARRLGIVVSRGVIVSDDEADIDLWVRAQPQGDLIRLSVSGWRELQPWRSGPRGAQTELDFQHADADWRWETDAALRLTFLSLDAGPRHGFDALALLGRPLTALFALDTDDGEAIPLIDSLARHRPLDAQPARLKGSGRPLVLSAVVRQDAHGAFAGFSGSVRMAETALAAPPQPEPAPLSTTFTEGLDKVLRSPLARIIANADSINAQADGPLRQDYVDYAADIAGAGRHLLGLVDDLVDLQAIERRDFALPVEPIDLADVARRAAGLLSVRAADAGVTISRPAAADGLSAQGDFRRTLQILVNLIGNAVRYSPPGASVEVAVARTRGQAMATVTDRGKGIAPDDQARIFEKFERVDTSEVGGNGLGLYIARRLARAMGGDLDVESAPGEGARFTLTLPAADPARGEY